jgi:uncharacterized protein (DUF488 family)
MGHEGPEVLPRNHTSPARSDPVLTIGHSTLPLEDFVHLLQAHGVKKVVDVRTIPRSRHNPQFNRETLPNSLRACGIDYLHMPGLGGLRHACSDSSNLGWRNASFRGYADYMQTPEFEDRLQRLIEQVGQEHICLMCAEALPWRCHRSLIADALIVRGIQVEHILSSTHRQAHVLTPWAKVVGTAVTYPVSTPSGPFRQE